MFSRKPFSNQNGRDGLVTMMSPRSPAAEAYRTLRTNIQFSSLDRPVRSILVTSTAPGEGKSTTLANLAIASAEAGKKVIIVDCDLRKPVLHQMLGLSNSSGFTTLLLEDGEIHVEPQPTTVPNLFFVGSGPLPPNPSELLSSHRVDRIVAALTEMADLAIFDSPPVLAVSDASILATKLDGVILVISAGKTKRELARRAKAQLEKVNARILGAVLNNVPFDAKMYQYYQTSE